MLVSERSDEGQPREVKVHFRGWSKAHDEWLTSDCLRPLSSSTEHDWGGSIGKLDGGSWEVEKLLKKRRGLRGKVQYLVRWRGWPADHLTWEPAINILDEDLIDEFDQSATTPPQPLIMKAPFTISNGSNVPPDVADGLVEEWVEDIGRKGAALLARAREEFASRRFFSMSPCPAWLFLALQRRLVKMAAPLEGMCHHITHVCHSYHTTSHRRGSLRDGHLLCQRRTGRQVCRGSIRCD